MGGMTCCAVFSHAHHSKRLDQGLLGSLMLVLAKQSPCGALHVGHGFGSRCYEWSRIVRFEELSSSRTGPMLGIMPPI